MNRMMASEANGAKASTYGDEGPVKVMFAAFTHTHTPTHKNIYTHTHTRAHTQTHTHAKQMRALSSPSRWEACQQSPLELLVLPEWHGHIEVETAISTNSRL